MSGWLEAIEKSMVQVSLDKNPQRQRRTAQICGLECPFHRCQPDLQEKVT